MKIKDVIKMANLMEKGNVLEPELAMFFLSELDGMIQSDMMLHGPEEVVSYTDQEQELMVRKPHDGIYLTYLVAMIRQCQGEFEGYNNAMESFNEKLKTFRRWYVQHYRPADSMSREYMGAAPGGAGYGFAYLTAYGLAVKHGYSGTEEEWLASLEGQPGAPGEAARMRFDDERGMIQWGVEGVWYDLFTIEELKDPVVEELIAEVRALAEQVGRDKEVANQAANTAAGYATAAGGHAKTAADAAADSLKFAGQAYASEQNAVTAAGDARVQAETAEGYAIRAEAAAKKAEEAAAGTGTGGNGSGPGQNQPYTLPVATADTLGGVKPSIAMGATLTQPVAVDGDGKMWTAAAASGTVLVAASDAPDIIKAAAQYVCTGTNDQMTINAAIQAVGKGEVRLSGGNYYITAEITLTDDTTLAGRNAIINVCDEISSTITQAYVGGDTVIHVADASKFVIGQKVSTDAGINSKYECCIIGIDPEANTVTLDNCLHSTSGFEADKYKLVADFTAVSCKYRENVIIDGLIVNSNGKTYTRYDTVLGCNGIELYSSTNCKIVNCTVRESRTHGIAVFVSTACTIFNSLVADCYELGIDLSNGNGGDGGHAIIGCTVEGCGNRGIQCHYAKRVNVVGCVLRNNNNGIGTQGSGQELIITGCNIYGNINRGVYCSVSPGKNVVISDSIIAANGEGIQFDTVDDASITGNIIMRNTKHGIKMVKSNRFVIANNKLMDNIPDDTKTEITTNAAIAITGACSYGLVIGNSITIDSTASKGCACGIAENNMQGGCNVVTGNIIKGARVQATRKLGENSKFENNYEFA